MATHHALLTVARNYVGRGWPVFVLGRTKRPVRNCTPCRTADAGSHDPVTCECLTCHGFYAATVDTERVAAMLRRVRGGLLAIRTGAVSGLAVVDIDPRNGGQLDTSVMNPTYTVRTGSGGWHLYYEHPGVPLAVELAGRPGVDIKADGGYVVAPPSIHPDTGRPYRIVGDRPVEEMAPALRAGCMPPASPPPPQNAPMGRSVYPDAPRAAGAISHPDRLLASILSALDRAPKGQHRRTLYGCARGVARMVLAETLTHDQARDLLTDAGRAAAQTEREIRGAIDGGFRDEGLTA